MVAHAFNPSTREAEASGSLWVLGQPGLQSEFQDRHQSYREILSRGKKKTNQKQTNKQTNNNKKSPILAVSGGMHL